MSAANIPPVTRDRTTTQISARISNILLYGTFGLLLFGPLAFGAVEPWSIFVMEAGATALLLLWIGKQILEGEVKIRMNPLFLPMGVFGALILLQLVLHRSAYPHDSASGVLLYCSYAMLCFLSSQTLLRESQARKLAVVFCIFGALVAAFALLQGISSNGRLYWIRQPRMGGWIYGPYVNHNHYAGLMELLVPIPLVLALTKLTESRERMAAAAAAAVMAGTIFLSGSRGGMLAIMVELVFFAIVLVKQKRNLQTAVVLGVFLLVVVGLLTWLGGGELASRMASIGTAHKDLSEHMRFQINRDGMKMFLSRPIFGWGLGTFPVVYPEFRSFYTNFFVNEAHDDYLQLLVEMGVLGFATMLWFIFVAYRTALKKIGNWTSEVSGALTLACTLGFTGILVHSAVDFNLQIPANAALFYVFCTLAATQPMVKPQRKRRAVRTRTHEEEMLPASEVV
jgi:O-antigen ligase